MAGAVALLWHSAPEDVLSSALARWVFSTLLPPLLSLFPARRHHCLPGLAAQNLSSYSLLLFLYLRHLVSYHNLSEIFPEMRPFVTSFLFSSSLSGPCIRLTYPIPGLFITISSLYLDLFLPLSPFTLPPELRNWITDLTTSLSWHPPHPPSCTL